ncbi:MAG: phosphoribosylglycinamide formyltransferase [Clostridia bacterium]|nr:phosphoribosylglycinamide formyltransferase [Clostridia bacterium]
MSTRIAVLCSGGGTNLQALIDAVEAGRIDGTIVLVLANASRAYALERARKHGIPAQFVSKKQAGSDEAFNDVILARLQEAEAELVVLAGYLPIVGPQIVRAYEHRIINIHPALIPAFCGPGMYGHHVHEAVLAYGAKISGATTHFVDEQVDHGGVIMQRCVPVLEGDTPDTLAARVLTVEHEILPESVRLYCAGKLGVDGRQVHVL